MTKKTIGAALIALYREEYGYEHTGDRAALIEKLQAVNRRVNWGAILDAAETVEIPYWERPGYVPGRHPTGAEVAAAWEDAVRESLVPDPFSHYWLLEQLEKEKTDRS